VPLIKGYDRVRIDPPADAQITRNDANLIHSDLSEGGSCTSRNTHQSQPSSFHSIPQGWYRSAGDGGAARVGAPTGETMRRREFINGLGTASERLKPVVAAKIRSVAAFFCQAETLSFDGRCAAGGNVHH
jgi:hypothetical protein